MIDVRCADGSPTPSLKDSVSDLFRYFAFHAEGRRKRHDFLDAKDARFHDFRKTHMKELAFQEIGVSVKQADPLTPKQDYVLWNKNFLGPHSSKSYIITVFYYNCKLFGLRGPNKHR